MRKTIKVSDARERLQGEIRILEHDIKTLFSMNSIENSPEKREENSQYANNLSKIVLGLEKAQDIITKLENR